MTTSADLPFWKTKSLTEMSKTEWESLCDGCARCCVHKLEDEETGEIAITNVACRLMDTGTCQCKRYSERARLVPDCIILTPQSIHELPWMPKTCAYRRLSEGQDLDWWHPLVSGTPETVITAGISMRGKLISERDAGDLEDHIIEILDTPLPRQD